MTSDNHKEGERRQRRGNGLGLVEYPLNVL
jgi:hypothetical protein